MAKSVKKRRKPTTNEALEQLLGRKAAKRLRKLAMQVAAMEAEEEGRQRAKKKPARE
jgi:hypothetical protein